MARARSGGGAYAVALVVLGCFFVVALLFAIINYTKIEKAEQAAADRQKEQAEFIRSNETTRVQIYKTNESSVASAMLDEIDSLNNQIGALNNQLAAAEKKANEAADQFNSSATQADQLTAQLAQQREQLLTSQQQSQAQIDDLRAQLKTLEGERDRLKQTVDTAIRNANDGAQKRIQDLTTDLGASQNEINELKDANAQLLRYKLLYEEFLKKDVVETQVTTADGEVASVFNNGDTLFINRGRNQGIVLGLTFEVFEPDVIISLVEGTEYIRGKATIEVFEVDDDTATCRVVRRTRNAMVDPGDSIANIVYDPHKTYLFYTFGSFDIERNGGTNDIGRIQNMIANFSGKTAELELDEDGLPIMVPEVDYLVLGIQPAYPTEPDRDEIDPEVIREWQEKVREYEIYQKLVEEAKRLRIPILNQNRFLDLVGYNQR